MKRNRESSEDKEAASEPSRALAAMRTPLPQPDFSALAESDGAFKSALETRTKSTDDKTVLDLTKVDEEFNLCLTRAILKAYFSIRYFEIPRSHLVPPVPNRHSYVLWINSLLSSLSPLSSSSRTTLVRGLDIGTGASCIYPLLGCRAFGWEFLASDVDPSSVRSAGDILERNGMKEQVEVVHCSVDDKSNQISSALGASKAPHRLPHFVMTNPPFYSNSADAESARQDGRDRTAFTSSESVCEGGEVGFVKRMVEDSVRLYRDKIGLYTAMLSKRSSMNEIIAFLKSKEVGVGGNCIHITEFCHGKVTRFGLCWTFADCAKRFCDDGGDGNGLTNAEMKERVEVFLKENQREDETFSNEEDGSISYAKGKDEWKMRIEFEKEVDEVADAKAAVNMRLTEFKDPKTKGHFKNFCERLSGEVFRTNRKWRRKKGK
ncbi:hypothetical protein TrST_g13716 [Triparma strigata]|uniref:U6 small nuclear RNA (adenine-(43)-N(6))-methyltransferase n=1 Tax=Triparma strigata TaxID=1606541 RepID=A0A9W7BS73_9STRA|nr:hypothetical protein TrST_g13716 [Triparma strigata]